MSNFLLHIFALKKSKRKILCQYEKSKKAGKFLEEKALNHGLVIFAPENSPTLSLVLRVNTKLYVDLIIFSE